ncbi:hypothetical protein D6853_14350 [Butyrivibrio sp. X503]|uniref:hypothetical protein n=1 Tax=Butyrivibrio sp. X503 TaxID=2364878 RepID=UPI000EE73BA2|nr:hypothetical protein [Butyrivibrio sp. X503]RKM54115.1 hypothetical protein D6853_14350 [Butyrivibrio sp. X503]
MKFKAIIALVLCGMMMTACAGKATEQQIENTDNVVTEVSTVTIESNETSSNVTGAFEEGTEYSIEQNSSDIYYSFNPHVDVPLIHDSYGDDAWNSFYDLCDAVRDGDDGFACADEDTFRLCLDMMRAFFPGAYPYIDLNNSYFSDGIGYIVYLIPKNEVVEKEREFEQEVENILRECVTKDYTDVEKCFALYDYIARNYGIDWEEDDVVTGKAEFSEDHKSEDVGIRKGIMTRSGVCAEFSGVYTYLLLQCGVDAMTYGANGHRWSYVRINGNEYHIDPTWGTTKNHTANLTYFMMTDAERKANIKKRIFPLKFRYKYFNNCMSYSAVDERFQVLRGGTFLSMDTENKVVYYELGGETCEYHYDA